MKNTLKRSGLLLVFGCIFSALLFTSCSEETLDSSSPVLEESQDLTIALKPTPAEPIMIEAESGEALRATQAPGVDRGRYNISLRYVVPVDERQQQVFEDAAARWERIIIKDETSIQGPFPSAFGGVPDIEGVVDDIVIEVALIPIDGPGNVLGAAGPQFVRTENFLTITGVMFFDTADLDFLDSLGLFEEVIVHEMGHVLGVGSLWNVAPFGFDRTLRGGSDDNPYFLGKKANVFWNAEGGTFELPIEGDFGPGTRFSHWDEAALNNELMTGFLNLGENPLSRITAGSMKDLGYGAASVGESYDLPKGTPGVEARPGEGLHIAEQEVILSPVGFVSIRK